MTPEPSRPCLRPGLEPMAVEVDGRRLVALRDPDGYSEETAVVEPGLLGVLALMDGTRSVEDIRFELARQGAGFIPIEVLQGLVDSLDEYCLLDSEAFRALERGRIEEFAALPVREAAHAGTAYPDDREEARAFLRAMLDPDGADGGGGIARLVAPHIDLQLGGEVYAAAHRRLYASGRPDVVVILGVCHQPSQARFIACRKDFATPFGPVRHDAALLDDIEARLGHPLDAEQILHRGEHSIEFQALWLAYLWPEDPPAIVPLLVGSFHDLMLQGSSPSDDEEIEGFAQALRAAMAADARRIVLLASIDLAHLGPRYGDEQGLDPAGEAHLEVQDRALLERVVAGDAEGFFAEVARDGNARNVCGAAPLYMLLRAGTSRGELLRYGQGRIDPGSGSVVSYAALAFAR